MEIAVRPLCIGLHPQIINQKQRTDMYARLLFPRRLCSSVTVKFVARQKFRRDGCKIPDAIRAKSSDLDNLGDSVTTLEDFTVTANGTYDGEIKIRVDVSGARTQAIFDDVFLKLVAAAQPIPGFRKVKGGKTPDVTQTNIMLGFNMMNFWRLERYNFLGSQCPRILQMQGMKKVPKDVLLHIIGQSKVNKKSMKKIINTVVAEYVQKESLKVTKDLRVEQSYEELESAFQPGNDFGFDAILHLQETRTTKC